MQNRELTYRIHIKGLVQGVGFRPFVYRLASINKLCGTVENRNDGVTIELNCTLPVLQSFIHEIKSKAPPASKIETVEYENVTEKKFDGFSIIKSTSVSDNITDVSPDIAVCSDCLEDMKFQEHRIGYPFINCTNCGPRFTIIRDLPYDRDKTTMDVFEMCPVCKAEYKDILNRRFHAQPVACNICGPEYTLHEKGEIVKGTTEIISRLTDLIESGGIAAIKGMGGFFIACDAMNEIAVSRLRKAKKREGKPFAVMFGKIENVKKFALLSDAEEKSLTSFRRPVVLLEQINQLAPSVTMGLSTLGVMLPYMPLHYLLMEKLKTPAIVLTSGNLSDEPIVIDDEKALSILSPVADVILTYNRHIYNRTDDSVVRIINSKERLIRRSRGYVPAPVITKINTEGIIATGAELTNCFAIGRGYKVLLSQHIGDLKNMETYEFFTESLDRFRKIFRLEPRLIVSDLHPDYLSTRYAKASGLQHLQVQHHHAHIVSCMAEHGLEDTVIGVAMDGTGLGEDGHIWGSEFMLCDIENYERINHFEYVPLPGGDKVTHEPWRTAVSYLYKYYGNDFFKMNIPFLKNIPDKVVALICSALDARINTPLSSGAGRLFDAVAALLNICPVSSFHAEAPMRLESIVDRNTTDAYPFEKAETIGFKPTFSSIINDMTNGIAVPVISARFHNTIAEVIADVVSDISAKSGIRNVVLSGGTFQNRYLLEKTEVILREKGLTVFSHERIPSNDGGLALGQIMIAAQRMKIQRKKL